ncbi:MAG: hypothetical protein RBU37_26265, partial [Myxococcota bacterium]|nr:hypothetical protein [Myxococcota bacterium]
KVIDEVRYTRYHFQGLLHDAQRTLEIRLAEDGYERSHVIEVARPEEGRPAWLVSIEDWNDDTHQLFFETEKGDFVDPLVFASKAFPEPIPTPQARVAFLRMQVVPADISVHLVVFEALPSGQWLVVDKAWENIEPERIDLDWDERSYPGWIASAFAYGLTVPLDIVTSPFQLIGLIVYAGAAWQ